MENNFCSNKPDLTIEQLATSFQHTLIILDSSQELSNYSKAQQVKRSISQTDIAGIVEVTENNLKRTSSLSKLVSNKGNYKVDTLMSISKNLRSGSTKYLNTLSCNETMSKNSILDLWEHSAIPNGRNILKYLGFDSNEINITELSNAMKEKIAKVEDEVLCRACLVLQKQMSKQLFDEEAKLRADINNSSRSISILPAESDEKHASVEDAINKEVYPLEQQDAGAITVYENTSNPSSRLKAKTKLFEHEVIKIKSNLKLVCKANKTNKGDKRKLKKLAKLFSGKGDWKRELTESIDSNELLENGAKKKLHNSPLKIKLIEKDPSLINLKKCTFDANSSCSENNASGVDWKSLYFGFNKDCNKEQNLDLKEKPNQTKLQLLAQSPSEFVSTSLLEQYCKERLEEMLRNYKETEDYWQTKLTNERTLFEKKRKLFEVEQLTNSKKSTEHMERVREYEKQFIEDDFLYPIEGQQYVAVEERETHKKFKLEKI